MREVIEVTAPACNDCTQTGCDTSVGCKTLGMNSLPILMSLCGWSFFKAK